MFSEFTCGGTGLVELDHAKLAERTVLALRGFGGPDVWCVIGDYGEELAAFLLRMSSYEEEILSSGAMWLISNRMTYGMSSL